MTERLTRATHVDLEIRGGVGGRTVYGLCCPFDDPTEVADIRGSYTEVFRFGAFARTIAERGAGRVKFLGQHDRRTMPLGRATLLREDSAGLIGEFAVSKTQAGDEALELIRDGALDGLSIGFRPVKDRQTRDALERLEVRLDEVSAVTFPAFAAAGIAGIRSAGPLIPVDAARARLITLRRK